MEYLRRIGIVSCTICGGALLASTALAELSPTLSLYGDVEIDTTYEVENYEQENDEDFTGSGGYLEGRTHLVVEGMVEGENGWYGLALGDVMVGTSGTVGVDDAYGEFGKDSFALRFGRYEAEGAFSLGEDVYIAEPSEIPELYWRGRYEGNFARGRFSGSTGQAGLHLGLGEQIELFLDGVIGTEDRSGSFVVTVTDPDTGVPTQVVEELPFPVSTYGFRPLLRYSTDSLEINAAFDYLVNVPKYDKVEVEVAEEEGDEGTIVTDNESKISLMGGALNMVKNMSNMSFGLSGAYGIEGGKDVDGGDLDDRYVLSTFGHMTIVMREVDALGLGLGYSKTWYDKAEDEGDNIESYISYIYQMPVEGLKLKFAGSYAIVSGDNENGGEFNDAVYGGRIRLNLDF